MLYFTTTPTCPNYEQKITYSITSSTNNRLGNTSRYFYKCQTEGYEKFCSFDDNRGIQDDSPLCLCGSPSRRIIKGKDGSVYNTGYLCAIGVCRFRKPGERFLEANLQEWIDNHKVQLYGDRNSAHSYRATLTVLRPRGGCSDYIQDPSRKQPLASPYGTCGYRNFARKSTA